MHNVFKVAAVAVAAVGLMGSTALATPLAGSYSINGGFIPVTLGGVESALGSAEALDFVPTGVTTPTPGTPGEFLVSQGTQDFMHLEGMTGLIQDVSLLGSGNVQYPVPPIPMFQQVGDVSFDLMTLSVSQQDDEFLLATGTGIFKRAGFDDTSGVMNFSAQTAGGVTFTWSASQFAEAQSVPEPTSMVLMGLGLLGVAATVRRRRTTR